MRLHPIVHILASAVYGLVCLIGLSACDQAIDSTPSGKKNKPSSHLVTAFTVVPTPVTIQHERPGSLRFRRLARIYSQEDGRITSLDVFEGDLVEADQLLITLEDDLLKAELDKVSATKRQAATDQERLEGLRRKRAASEDELAQARTALTLAEADERLLTTRLAFTRIHAPFAGIIVARLVEPGDFVTRNTHLLTIADPASLTAELYASELVLPFLQTGDQVRVRIDALGNDTFDGRILRIHPRLEQTSRQGIVEVTFEQIPDGARAGQFVRATLGSAPVERLMIPFRALQRKRDGEFLWLIGTDSKAIQQPVQSGLRVAQDIEIVSGVEPGALAITRGFLGLTDGKTVEIVAGDADDR